MSLLHYPSYFIYTKGALWFMIGFLIPKTDSAFFSNRVIQDLLDLHGASKEPNNPLKKWAWNWYSSRPLLNKLGVHSLIQRHISELQRLSTVVGEFQDLVFVLYVSGLKNSRAKIFFFSTFIQTWNNYLFIFYRESRSLSLHRNIVILSSDRIVCLHNPRSSYWSSATFPLQQNRYQYWTRQ